MQNWSLISSRGYFPKYSHLAIPAKLHGPKGDRINESLLYSTKVKPYKVNFGCYKEQRDFCVH